MRAYSTDLRQRIVESYNAAEGSVREVAARFKVAARTVQNYLNLERETGGIAPRPHGGGPAPKLDDAGVQEVRAIVEEKNDRTLHEIADELDARLKVHVGLTTVWHALKRLDLPRKKKTLRASEQDRPDVRRAREVFQQKIEEVDPERRFFLDEFGFNLGMTRLYARAPSSERAYAKVPERVGSNITLVLGVGLRGIVAPFAFAGAMNAHVFAGYFCDQVVPLLPPAAVVVVDNLGAHYAEDTCEALEERGIVVVDDLSKHHPQDTRDASEKRGIELWFLPPYSPEMSPAEECGSKVKALTRGKDARTASALIDAMGDAIGQVTPQDARGWFDHARRDRAPHPRPQVNDGGKGGAPSTDQPRAGPSG
jgi:transposase